MSDFELFSPSEGGEAYDPAAFERFKEKVKKNAAFQAAARRDEARQKVKEDRLAKILSQFIQRNQKSGILMLAAKLLKENIPASFILSIIVLGNEELQKEAGFDLQKLDDEQNPMQEEVRDAEGNLLSPSAPTAPAPGEFAIVRAMGDATLPLKLKVGIDQWGKGIFEVGSTVPFRVLETVLNDEGKIKHVVIDCAAHVMTDFFETNKGPYVSFDTFFSFCELLMQNIIQRLQKQIENQKELN